MASPSRTESDWRSEPTRVVWVVTGTKQGVGYEEDDMREIIGIYESAKVADAAIELVEDEYDDVNRQPWPVVVAGQVAEARKTLRAAGETP